MTYYDCRTLEEIEDRMYLADWARVRNINDQTKWDTRPIFVMFKFDDIKSSSPYDWIDRSDRVKNAAFRLSDVSSNMWFDVGYSALEDSNVFHDKRHTKCAYNLRRAVRGLRRIRNPSISNSGVSFDAFLRSWWGGYWE